MTVDLSVPVVHLHIGGEARTSGSGGVHQHVYPATGEVQGPVPLAGRDDVDAAARAAHAAHAGWRSWRPSERARVLRRLGELIERDAAEIARLSVLDNGMSTAMSRPLVDIMANWTSYYAGWADKIEGRVTSFPANQRELAYSMPEPYGVVGIILTWNGPVVSIGMKLIPALAAGNTVVMKPSELTPYATEHLMRLVKEAGIPDGVVNLVLGGPETGDALVGHPLVQKVSFTGGPATARKILARCAESLKPAVLELGGKSANVLFADADLDTAIAVNAFSVLGTLAGQGCAIPSRMIVQNDIYDDVVARVLAIVAGMQCGDPFDPATVISPVVTRAAQERILAMIERAQADGAKLLAGGGVPGHLPKGFFVEPTVFGDVDPASELGQVEVFGPVLSLMRFDTEEQAIAMANSTEYGLASYVYTRDVDRVQRMVTALRAGGVYVNGASPVTGYELAFGGVGISGFGREGGEEGLFEFLRTKAVGIG
ncbi:aldehyde dehydrogenase family protein [Mycobacterium sp. 663a-19]|uniref:aldehyde dehydrogenase family protein n=1 Tax=Mycobacterium sp. 663a-19 TaxID=2986148 RepID=UPI002D1EBF88|nr:aldehyde dehydrogenase family protein [Mycobacterium sp. 663a-19]MEB3982026.1 aldehyde dehydrogenase family protein [Mycobacterium sp. 663a-19]